MISASITSPEATKTPLTFHVLLLQLGVSSPKSIPLLSFLQHFGTFSQRRDLSLHRYSYFHRLHASLCIFVRASALSLEGNAAPPATHEFQFAIQPPGRFFARDEFRIKCEAVLSLSIKEKAGDFLSFNSGETGKKPLSVGYKRVVTAMRYTKSENSLSTLEPISRTAQTKLKASWRVDKHTEISALTTFYL